MPAAPSTTSLAIADVVDAEQLALLEAAYALPAVEPAHAATGRIRRRAAVVTQAVDAGITPLELFAAALFVILGLGLATIFVLSLAA